VLSWPLRQQLRHRSSAGIRAAAATLLSGIQHGQHPAALGRTVPAEHNAHGCRWLRRHRHALSASRRPAGVRRDRATTKHLPRSSRPRNANLRPLPPPAQRLLREISPRASASFPAAWALRRGGVAPSETGSWGTSRHRGMGTAPATLAARRGLPEPRGAAWEQPSRATVALLLVYHQVSLLVSHAAHPSPLQRSNDFKANSVTQTLPISSQQQQNPSDAQNESFLPFSLLFFLFPFLRVQHHPALALSLSTEVRCEKS